MTAFAQALKTWRSARRLSQLDLALEADISARHISFLETGRARPSREMVSRLGEALHLPLDARNQLLTHAGFAARYETRAWDAADMIPIRRAVTRQLDRHLPYPGLAIDRLWRVKDANATARALFAPLGLAVGGSLLDLMMSETLPQIVENWPTVAHHAAVRLRTESTACGGIPEFAGPIAYLSAEAEGHAHATGPVVPTILRLGETRLSMFATLAQFGTPEDLLLADLRIELYYPMDDGTAAVFDDLAGAGA